MRDTAGTLSLHAGAALAATLAATTLGLTAPPEAPYADPKGVIAAAHRKQDDDIKGALMSPFTAIDAHYLDAGATTRVGADGEKLVFDPTAPMAAMVAVSYATGDFFASPIAGAKGATLRKSTDEGGLVPGDGTAVASRTKIGDGEVVVVGRFLLAMSPQSGTGRVLVYDPESPMKRSFTGLKWFPPDLELQVNASFAPDSAPKKISVGTSRGLKKEFVRAGTFEFEVGGVKQHLAVLAESGTPKDGDDIFIPFRDATTGKESYDVGRYLNMKFKTPDARYIIDFNDAGNPSCNYSPFYNCPIPPAENTLTVPIRAGEMTYPAHH
ncbi:MAG: DUF1684 domain-containing protein [Acidobacteria bacterium]|nr:DUF1684 domain-containing protein [Acidobacteriota bacterium]